MSAFLELMGSSTRSQLPRDKAFPAFQFFRRNLKAQQGLMWAPFSVCSCGPLQSPHSPKTAFPAFPPYLDHSSPFTSSSSQKGLWQLQHLPQPIHHHCLQLCARWACSLPWGLGEKVEELKPTTGHLASAQKGDMEKHCFFGDFYLINLTESSHFFVPQIHPWWGTSRSFGCCDWSVSFPHSC